jgi:hypothetical protein
MLRISESGSNTWRPHNIKLRPLFCFIFRRFVVNGEVCGFQILAHEADSCTVEQSGSHCRRVSSLRSTNELLSLTHVLFYVSFSPICFLFLRAGNSWRWFISIRLLLDSWRTISASWCWCCFLAATSAKHCAFSSRDAVTLSQYHPVYSSVHVSLSVREVVRVPFCDVFFHPSAQRFQEQKSLNDFD